MKPITFIPPPEQEWSKMIKWLFREAIGFPYWPLDNIQDIPLYNSTLHKEASMFLGAIFVILIITSKISATQSKRRQKSALSQREVSVPGATFTTLLRVFKKCCIRPKCPHRPYIHTEKALMWHTVTQRGITVIWCLFTAAQAIQNALYQ